MGILGSLFGGSKNSSTSDNKSYDFLQGALGNTVSSGANSFNALRDELSGGFDAYKKKSGFDAALGSGLRGITGGAAASGALRSGGTGKAYVKYGDDLASQRYDNYLGNMKGLTDTGLSAAGILAGAGQTSSSKGSSSPGMLNTLFSDRRLKDNIQRVGTADNGLPIYVYTYKGDPVPDRFHIGFMADEVKAVYPEAVTRDLTGYDTVDYGKAVL